MRALRQIALSSLFAALLVGEAVSVSKAQDIGYSIQPLKIYLDASSPAPSARLRITNKSNSKIVVNLSVNEISATSDAGDEESPADNQFVVFPPQMSIPEGSVQMVQIQYVGEPDQAKYYNLTVDQIPLSFSDGGSASKMSYAVQYVLPVFLQPSSAEANVIVSDVSFRGGKVVASLRNSGNAIARIRDMRFSLKLRDGKTVQLDSDSVTSEGPSILTPGESGEIQISSDYTNHDIETILIEMLPTS